MIRTITISREYGSGGAEVAEIIARRLGWKLIDNSLIAEIAKAAEVNPALARQYDECVDPWFHRLAKAMWQGGYEGAASTVETSPFDADAMVALCRRALEEAASIGNCVTVGRGGQCILRGRDVFHVFIYAPVEERIRRLRARIGGTDEELARLAEETDRMRATYIRRYFGEEWNNPLLYELIISSSVGLERAASAIICAAGLAGGD
jgi:cytidylate kinase